jgi:penicillin amidase
VGANNAFVRPDDFPTIITRYYDYGQRAGRIETLIQQSEVHSMDTVTAIQNDTYNPMAPYLLPILADIEFDDPDLEAARDWLLEWDGRNDADSGGATLFNALWMYLVPLAFDELEPAGGVPGGTREMFLMRGMLAGDHPLWQNAELDTNDRHELLAMAFQSGYEYLVDELGPDFDSWRWDALHISYAQNTPFGRLPAGVNIGLDLMINDIYRTFNRQIGVPGGLENINNQRWDARNGDFQLDGAVVSMRMIVDFSDFDNSRFVHELGQSGDPFSPHFDDMSELWASGNYHPYAFTPQAVEAITERTLILTPR